MVTVSMTKTSDAACDFPPEYWCSSVAVARHCQVWPGLIPLLPEHLPMA